MEQSLKFLYKRLYHSSMSKDEVEGKVCQEVFLAKVGNLEDLKSHVVFKGGIILNALTQGTRGYTKDIDFDLVRYPLSDEGLASFTNRLNESEDFSNIKVALEGVPQELRQKNYQGKRVVLCFSDGIDRFFLTVDIGVFKPLVLRSKLFEYEVAFGGKKKIRRNSNEQMIAEKLSTFSIYGTDNSRYKDFFDAYWLMTHVPFKKDVVFNMLWQILRRGHDYKNLHLALSHTIDALKDEKYLAGIQKTAHNWTSATVTEISDFLCSFLKDEA